MVFQHFGHPRTRGGVAGHRVNQKRDGALEPVLRKRLVDGLQHFQLRVPVQTVPAFDLRCSGSSPEHGVQATKKQFTQFFLATRTSVFNCEVDASARSMDLFIG